MCSPALCSARAATTRTTRADLPAGPGRGLFAGRPVSAVDGFYHISSCRNKKEDGVLFSSTAGHRSPTGRPHTIRPVC
jgi:hypothetical protein